MRRAGFLLAVVALWTGAQAPAWGNHLNCSNFQSQEDAQAYFDAHPGDRARDVL